MQIIKKNMVALAVAGALVSPLAVMAADAEVSGFIDVIANTDSNPVFTADAEIDVSKEVGAVTVRVDFDMNLAGNGGTTGTDSGRLEQAFFAWAATEQVTVLGGLFNNPIGQEAEDAPDLNFTSHSAIWNILDNQTALYGNNLAGVAAAIAAGPATVTLAIVDDLGFATNDAGDKGKTSVALVVNAAPMPGLDLELGYVTQDDQEVAGSPTTAGDVLDFNAAFKTGPVTLGLDYLMADNIVDNAVNLWVGFEATPEVTIKARYETVAFEANGTDDSTKTTLHAAYSIEDNLLVALEWSDSDTDAGQVGTFGFADDSVTTLEFVGTF